MIRAIGKFIDRKQGGKVFAHELIEEPVGVKPTREIITLSASLDCGAHICGESGLWPVNDFQLRFSIIPNNAT
jgi:hypothetical protein